MTRVRVLSRGSAQWCGERGEFVQLCPVDGDLDDRIEMTPKEFARFYRPIDGDLFE